MHGRANQWLDEVQSGNFPEKMKGTSFKQVADAVTKKMGGVNEELGIQWFARYGDSPHMSERLITSAAMGFRNQKAIQGLDFLKTAVDFPALQQSREGPQALGMVISNSDRHDPAQLEQWLEQNREVPFYATASELYLGVLDRMGETERAAEWKTRSGE